MYWIYTCLLKIRAELSMLPILLGRVNAHHPILGQEKARSGNPRLSSWATCVGFEPTSNWKKYAKTLTCLYNFLQGSGDLIILYLRPMSGQRWCLSPNPISRACKVGQSTALGMLQVDSSQQSSKKQAKLKSLVKTHTVSGDPDLIEFMLASTYTTRRSNARPKVR